MLGISAGIAAYKAAELARLLIKEGAAVQVVMTTAAAQFIGPLTLQAITGREVRDALFDVQHEAAMGHIELARWADLVIVAPATADFLARAAHGLANDLLTTLCLATTATVFFAPAMNQAMWRHPATVDNVLRLTDRNVRLLGPDQGEQACGDIGAGRMAEPAAIVEALVAASSQGRFVGRRVLVTAGPTREAIDPVRFIGNRSSGKMGFAVAEAFANQGADVTLVAGPVALATPPKVQRVDVETAREMHDAVLTAVTGQDIFVATAAVADYRPADAAAQKVKKSAPTMDLVLTRNPDILADVSARPERPFCVGFAAETQDLAEYAKQKLQAKGLDMIAANQVSAVLGFDKEENALLVLWGEGQARLPMQPKKQLAGQLIELIADRFDAQTAAKDS